LHAASRIFAEKGFQRSTVAEICREADANVASINYHFGDKETIYLEAWRYAFKRELAQFPPDGGVSRFAAPEERLAGRIRSLIQRIADENSHSFAILHKEMTNPSRVLGKIIEMELHPLRMQMLQILRECIGREVDDRQIHYCHASIMGQCFQLLRLKYIDGVNLGHPDLYNLNDVEAFVEHVIRFSLAGVRACQQQSSC